MPTPYPQRETRRRVLAAVRAGALTSGWPADLPVYRTVLAWVRADPEFAAALTRARARAPRRGAAPWWLGTRPTYDQAAAQGRVLEALRAGVVRSAWPADLPNFHTVWRWTEADAGFAAAVRAARARGRAARWDARAAQRAYSYAKRDAFLDKVRAGVPMGELTRRAFPGPNKLTLRGWLRQDGWFSAELVKAKRQGARVRASRPRQPFDPDVADAVIVALSKGVTLQQIWKTPGMPGKTAMARWRAEQPDFASGLEIARRVSRSVRARARRMTPQVERRIMDHIIDGGSLYSAGKVAGLPASATLQMWKRRSAAFAEEVRWAEKFRTERLNEQALELGPGAASRAIEARLGRLRGGNRPKEG